MENKYYLVKRISKEENKRKIKKFITNIFGFLFFLCTSISMFWELKNIPEFYAISGYWLLILGCYRIMINKKII